MNAFSWSDIQAYCGLHHIRMAPWELQAVCDLDEAFLMSRLTKAGGSVKGAKALKGNMTGKAAR